MTCFDGEREFEMSMAEVLEGVKKSGAVMGYVGVGRE